MIQVCVSIRSLLFGCLLATSSSKIFPIRHVSTYEYKTGINVKRKKKYKHIHTLIKKRKENSPVKSGNPTELEEEALMPGSLLLCELRCSTGGIRNHRNGQKQQKTKWIFFKGRLVTSDKEGRGGCRESLRDEGDRKEDVKGEISWMQTR